MNIDSRHGGSDAEEAARLASEYSGGGGGGGSGRAMDVGDSSQFPSLSDSFGGPGRSTGTVGMGLIRWADEKKQGGGAKGKGNGRGNGNKARGGAARPSDLFARTVGNRNSMKNINSMEEFPSLGGGGGSDSGGSSDSSAEQRRSNKSKAELSRNMRRKIARDRKAGRTAYNHKLAVQFSGKTATKAPIAAAGKAAYPELPSSSSSSSSSLQKPRARNGTVAAATAKISGGVGGGSGWGSASGFKISAGDFPGLPAGAPRRGMFASLNRNAMRRQAKRRAREDAEAAAEAAAVAEAMALSLAESESAKAAARMTPRELFGRKRDLEEEKEEKEKVTKSTTTTTATTTTTTTTTLAKDRSSSGDTKGLLDRQALAEAVRGMVDRDESKYKSFQVRLSLFSLSLSLSLCVCMYLCASRCVCPFVTSHSHLAILNPNQHSSACVVATRRAR